MLRTIYQGLCQLLRSLLGRASSDPDTRADQDTDQETGQAGAASEAEPDANRTADDVGRPGADGRGEPDDRPDDVEDDSEDNDDDQADSKDGSDQDDSSDDLDIQWPPERDPVPWPARPDDPENTIEVRLFHADPDLGLQACRQAAPHLAWALLDAWSERFGLDVDVTVRTEPVPDEHTDPGAFSSWIWDDVEMAKDANILIVNSGGAGAAAGYSGFINGPDYFAGWGFDPAETDAEGRAEVTPYGGGEGREGANRVIHETLHCLGISHANGRLEALSTVEWYGTSYLPPLLTSYESHSRYTIRLCEAIRHARPSVQ
jgi:hypothetical protein